MAARDDGVISGDAKAEAVEVADFLEGVEGDDDPKEPAMGQSGQPEVVVNQPEVALDQPEVALDRPEEAASQPEVAVHQQPQL